jgi:uncharacterized protein (TIGR02246 family)
MAYEYTAPPFFTPDPRMKRILASFSIAAALGLAGCANSPTPSGTALPPTSCAPISEQQVASLFDGWNASLATGDPHKVVARYATQSILLPTVSNKPRLTPAEKEDYFEHFLQNGPSGKIDLRFVRLGCNMALDAGLYTFTFAKTGAVVKARYSYTYEYIGGQWLITSHHSSAMPEK